MNEFKFDGGICHRIDDLPDHAQQEMDDLAMLIIRSCLVNDNKDGLRPHNIGFGALQKALGLIVARFFRKRDHKEVIDSIYRNLKSNADEWWQGDD